MKATTTFYFMRKFWIVLPIVLLFSSCQTGKKTSDESSEVSGEGITVPFTSEDSVQTEVAPVLVIDTIPISADNSFDDFFYNFISDSTFQRKRIDFPLYQYKENNTQKITAQQWKFDPIFVDIPIYTVIYDRLEDLEQEKASTSETVQVEWIYLKKKQMKQYTFHRKKGVWYLESIQTVATSKGNEGDGEDFLDFYIRFASDSVFQAERLAHKVKYVTTNPDDEFDILETTLLDGQWFAFKPPISPDILTNIRYGQPNDFSSKEKIIEFKGMGNGFNNLLKFEKVRGIWKLVRFEDASD